MSVLQFGGRGCEEIRRHLDAYLSDELLVETNYEVLKHLEACAGCATELQQRTQARELLQRAVRAEMAPAGLEEQIRSKIHSSSLWPAPVARNWVLAAATVVMACAVAWVSALRPLINRGRSPVVEVRTPADPTARILQIGLTDHLECANNWRSYKKIPPAELRRQLAAEYPGLVPLVAEKMESYDLISAHHCKLNTRPFVHLLFLRDNSRVLSVILTPKDGDSFPKVDDSMLKALGVELHGLHMQGYEVAGFESRQHLIFVASDLPREENRRVAADLAGSLREYLAKAGE